MVNNKDKIPKSKVGSIKKLGVADVGVVYGGELIGHGVVGGLKFLDALRPAGFLGQPLSFWGDLIGAAGGALGALYWESPFNMFSALIGGYLATDLVDQIFRMVPFAVAAVAPPPTTAVFVPSGPTRTSVDPSVQFAQKKGYVYDMQQSGMQNVTVKAPIINGGRYTV